MEGLLSTGPTPSSFDVQRKTLAGKSERLGGKPERKMDPAGLAFSNSEMVWPFRGINDKM